jgi:hypothetical protein
VVVLGHGSITRRVVVQTSMHTGSRSLFYPLHVFPGRLDISTTTWDTIQAAASSRIILTMTAEVDKSNEERVRPLVTMQASL